ncbi:hypothetical protein H261_02196 [Paramagnetospirillum caucaseum]|uniref:Periplasmic ligand-binding sensor protein n=1 Tax=Paramagnetospirillum caucaseum TaxID=1244869 RepID=M2ZBA6_9PROT|nr:DUF2076 domain-containing protein [Paramagnetospirillum caucaseum]EME71705.1 hypothetical protein H261_02196 [Paramagnetospirillum caucaseum]
MTPQERDLIQSVFDRLARLSGGPKDREAEALILDRLRSVPDSAYNLVEAVVVQEMAIKENEARIRDLEARLANQTQPQQQPAPGFGRSAWGGGRGSVPSTQAPQQQAQQQQYAQQPQQYGQPSPWGGQPSAGGGFLRTAAGAAVGVAGGMLLANSISGMFAGGSHGGGAPSAQQASDTGGHAPADAPPVGYDTNVADDQGYGGFDSGFDMGGDDSF